MKQRGPGLAAGAPAPWTFAAPWGARGYRTDLPGHAAVHWIEFPASPPADPAAADPASTAQAPPLVFVHGLGGSHLNWALIAPALAAGRRAVALDLHGFGLTPGDRRTATVPGNTDLLDTFLREVAGTPAILVGNSMGGLISLLQAHAHPETVAGLVLLAPALPAARQRPDWAVASRFLIYATPGLGEFWLRAAQARVSPRQAVLNLRDLCYADPSRADPVMLDAGTALAEYRRTVPGCDESLLAAARSLLRVTAQRARYEAIMAAVTVPVLLIGGTADRLVPVASVRRAGALNPHWDTRILPGVGHTAQLETPELVAAAVRDWLGRSATLTGQ